MSPIPYSALGKRDDDSDPDDDTCIGFCGSGYVRWVVAIVIILFAIVLVIAIWSISVRRITGRWGFTRQVSNLDPTDTGILRRSHRQRRRGGTSSNVEEADPVPVYNETPGQDDAGYYDARGNYVAHEPPPYEPPKAVLRTEQVELESITTSRTRNGSDASTLAHEYPHVEMVSPTEAFRTPQ